ncbi:MAG: SocA family protein [Clostridiaceae bacterium]|nr:SocA family protein [Clostridiaceae bacterium]
MDKLKNVVPVIKKISEYQQPGKKALQKLIYLIQKKGVDLGFDFSIHYYGPYSSSLDDSIHVMQLQGVVEIIPDGMNHRICLTDLSDMVENGVFSPIEEETIESVLESFGSMSAFDLELITTTDFVARELCKTLKNCTENDIIDGVKKIKGEKFSCDKIKQAILLLRENGYQWN